MILSRIIRGSQQSGEDIRPFALQDMSAARRWHSAVNSDRVIRGMYPAAIQIFTFPPMIPADQAGALHDQVAANGSLPVASTEAMISLLADSFLPGEVAQAGPTTSLTAIVPLDRKRIFSQAQEEAERYLAETRARTADLEANAYQQGFSKGEEAARREVAAQVQSVLVSFQQAASSLAGLRLNVLRQAEEDVVTLAFSLARKIIHQEALEHREVLTQTLHRAFDRLADQEHVEVRLHPADLDYASRLQADIIQRTSALKTLTMKADPSVGPGGCIVESALGTVDARLEVQAEELEQRFRQQCLTSLEASAA